jgi:hypothetical protein
VAYQIFKAIQETIWQAITSNYTTNDKKLNAFDYC